MALARQLESSEDVIDLYMRLFDFLWTGSDADKLEGLKAWSLALMEAMISMNFDAYAKIGQHAVHKLLNRKLTVTLPTLKKLRTQLGKWLTEILHDKGWAIDGLLSQLEVAEEFLPYLHDPHEMARRLPEVIKRIGRRL
jgi:hypothetical protein